MQKDAAFKSVPILAITAYVGKEEEASIRKAVAAAYLSKPISILPFITTVRPPARARFAQPSLGFSTSANGSLRAILRFEALKNWVESGHCLKLKKMSGRCLPGLDYF